ncbi:hypothetical protein Tco_0846522 [Tanacetum coccineum]
MSILNNFGEWDAKAESGTLTPLDIDKRDEWLMDHQEIEQAEIYTLRQKSQIRWAVEGDENSRFFHATVKNNFAKNSINGIYIDGTWCKNPETIKNSAMDHFANRFKERCNDRPKFCSPLFRVLSHSEFLESCISMDEVKSAVWSCTDNKSPGPDGLNFNFIKAH